MFEKLFGKVLSVVVSHRAAPYAAERERFLEHCAQQGYSRKYLQKLARTLLSAAQDLRSHGGLRVGPRELKASADRMQQIRRDLHRGGGALSYREEFVRATTQWLRFTGHLRMPVVRPRLFSGLIDDFADWMAEERGLSTRTIESRRWHAERFLRWLYGRNRRLSDLLLQDVDAFFQALYAKGFSRVTIKIYADAVRTFVRHAGRRGWCASGIADAIRGPRIYRHHELPVGPSWEDVKKLIDDAASDEPVDIRDRAIIMLFAIYGFRASEVANLRLDDIDWEHDRIVVPRSKQRRSQVYPLAPTVGHAVIRYLKEARPRCARRELFLKVLAPVGPLTAKSLYRIVASRIVRLGIKAPRRGPHALRHACAGRLLSEGLSLKEIGDHLGHRSLDSTRVYAKVDLQGLCEVASFDLGEVA